MPEKKAFTPGNSANLYGISWKFQETPCRAYSIPHGLDLILHLTIERCPLLQKLYKALFQYKALRGLNGGGGEIFGALFFKKSALSGTQY